MPTLLAVNVSIEQIAAIFSIASALAAWAVIPWRVSQVERRLERLETSERDMASRMTAIETELRMTRHTVEKIAEKLNVAP